MKKLGTISEADLARDVVTELQRQGYVTYEEVSVGYAGRRADIVATRGPVVTVIECKVRFSLKLLDQLTAWIGHAHVVIGACGFTLLGVAAKQYLTSQGLGLWTVGCQEVHEKVSPRLCRRAAVMALRRNLRPEMQSEEFARAGTQGGYWTPFRGTCRALLDLVAEKPGIELRLAMKEIAHHYASHKSAMSSLPGLIRNGTIQGVRVEGKSLQLYRSDEAAVRRGGAATG